MANDGSVLLTSVPAHEEALARRVLPGAVVTAARLDAALAAAHPDVEVLAVASQDAVPESVLAAFPRLRAVVTRSAGSDHLPVRALRERGVLACHLAGYATTSVVEHTLLLILALVRRLPEAISLAQGRAPSWQRSRVAPRGLDEVTVGVLGTGRIGGALVRRLVRMGVRVVGYDIGPDPRLVEEFPAFGYVTDLDAFLSRADVLSLHVPLTPTTRGMMDAARLARLPRGAVLVNTARGAVVVQEAVLAALDAGHLAGYAADVLPGEPEPPGLTAFQGHPKVILTPHVAAYDRRALMARYATTAHVVRAVLAGDTEAVTPYLAEELD